MNISGREKNKIMGEAGVILGYEITEKVFNPILKLAEKGKQGWKLPTFIKNLIDNPAPLLLEEQWLYDKGAVTRAINWLKAGNVKNVEKLDFVFSESNRFEAISMQTLFNDSEDVNAIVEAMKIFGGPDFFNAIEPLERVYGEYAKPNNYQYERMNAGIIKRMLEKHSNLNLLDDSLRAPVYEYLGTTKFSEYLKGKKIDDDIIRVTQESLTPLPGFEKDWKPEEFIKILKSKGANQLREVIKTFRAESEINDNKITSFINRSRALSLSLSPTRNIIYAFSSLGASFLSCIGALASPYMYVPSAIFAAVSAEQFYNTIKSRIKKESLRWLDVADQLAKWCILN